MRLNTLYRGSCFLILERQKFASKLQTLETHININLRGNVSSANLYLLPQKGINSVIFEEWHYPVEKVSLHNFEYMEKVLKKEFYTKISTKEIPCIDKSEEVYYEVCEVELFCNYTLDTKASL